MGLAYRLLPEGSLSFRKHSPSKSADIRIAREGCPEEFSAGFLLSISAPHYTTQKYIVAVHFAPSLQCLCLIESNCCLAFLRACMPFSMPSLGNVEFRMFPTIVNLGGRSLKAPANDFAIATVRIPLLLEQFNSIARFEV